jgi:hypothetical protein
MELVVVEVNTRAELDATECVEVAGAELVGGMDLGSGHNGRRGAAWAGLAPACGAGRIRHATASGGAQHRASRPNE